MRSRSLVRQLVIVTVQPQRSRLGKVVRAKRSAPGGGAHLAVDGQGLLLLELSRDPIGLRSEDAVHPLHAPPPVMHPLLVGPDKVTMAREPPTMVRLLAEDHPAWEIGVLARVDRLRRL